jgi:hypothetical protein
MKDRQLVDRREEMRIAKSITGVFDSDLSAGAKLTYLHSLKYPRNGPYKHIRYSDGRRSSDKETSYTLDMWKVLIGRAYLLNTSQSSYISSCL